MSIPVEKFLYNRREAALSLGMSIRSVDYIISRRDLETRRVGKKVLVTRESLRRFAGADHPKPIRPTDEAPEPTTMLTDEPSESTNTLSDAAADPGVGDE
jgi:hypothetical protein